MGAVGVVGPQEIPAVPVAVEVAAAAPVLELLLLWLPSHLATALLAPLPLLALLCSVWQLMHQAP